MSIYRVSARYAGRTVTYHRVTLLPTLIGHSLICLLCLSLSIVRPEWSTPALGVSLLALISAIVAVQRWRVFQIRVEPERLVVRCPTLLPRYQIFPVESIVRLELQQSLPDLWWNMGTLTITTHAGTWSYAGLTPYDILCAALS